MNFDRIILLPYISKIQLSFSLIGIFFYLSIAFLFFFYYNSICFLREEIFSFILLNSVFSLIELFIDDANYRILFTYSTQVILFSLLLLHINKCFTQKKIVENIEDLELKNKIYVILIFMLIFFPFDFYFNLQVIEKCALDIVKVVLTVFLYFFIFKRIKLIQQRLKEQQIKSKNAVNYAMDSKENYYLKMTKTINTMYQVGFLFFTIYLSVKIYLLYNYNEVIEFIAKFGDYFGIACLMLAELLFFFCSNKIELEKGIRKGRFNNKIKKFVIIKIFNQEDIDDIINF